MSDRSGETMRETISKFGLDYCDLPTILWNITTLLIPLILDVDSRHKGGIPRLFYFLSPVIAAFNFYVYIISTSWFVFWKCRETGDIISALVMFSLGVCSQIGTVKLIFMYFYSNTTTKILNGYLHCDALVARESRMFKNMMKTLRVVKKRAMIFWIVMIMNGVVYVTKALLTPGRHLTEDQLILLGLEPMFESPNYEVSFILITSGVVFTCYLAANTPQLLIVLSGYTETHILALSEELLHLWEDAERSYKDTINKELNLAENSYSATMKRNQYINKYIKFNLENIAETHSVNITLIRQVEHVFRGPVAAGILILIISIIAILLGGVENTYLELPFTLTQVTMDCLTGQRLIDASTVFENAVYDCKWENFDANNRKTVLLMLQNAQKTITLSAGGISSLSFASLMAIIKTIYSMYTTLRSTMKN